MQEVVRTELRLPSPSFQETLMLPIAPKHPPAPDEPRGDTQPEADPTHTPLDEDTEDDADLDRFLPGA